MSRSSLVGTGSILTVLRWYGNYDMQTATKIIGYGLVMGGAVIKFPQIIKVIGNKSVLGISFVSVILEVPPDHNFS